MGKGRRFELDTKNSINDNTRDWVKAHRPDFSGSSAGEVADIMVVWQANRYDDQRPCGHSERHVAYGELKKRSGEAGNRSTVMSGSSDGQSGLEELQELRQEAPAWTKKVVGVKFPNRELAVFDAEALEHWLRRDEDGWGSTQKRIPTTGPNKMLGARLTPSNNISMVMPELHYWDSQSAGEPPWKTFCLGVGLEPYDFMGDTR